MPKIRIKHPKNVKIGDIFCYYDSSFLQMCYYKAISVVEADEFYKKYVSTCNAYSIINNRKDTIPLFGKSLDGSNVGWLDYKSAEIFLVLKDNKAAKLLFGDKE